MSTGQTLLTIGALVIFGYLALNVNRINLNLVQFTIGQQRSIDAVMYGQSLVERVLSITYNDIDETLAPLNSVYNPDSRLSFVSQIGDTLFATFSVTNQNNILFNTDGKLIEIYIYERDNLSFNTLVTYKVSVPELN